MSTVVINNNKNGTQILKVSNPAKFLATLTAIFVHDPNFFLFNFTDVISLFVRLFEIPC